MFDFAVVDSGIVGLCTLKVILQRHPNARLLLDKEPDLESRKIGNSRTLDEVT